VGEIYICRRNTVMLRYWVNKCHSGFNEDRFGEYILMTWVKKYHSDNYWRGGGGENRFRRGKNAHILV
jgi:hypothetical protein